MSILENIGCGIASVFGIYPSPPPVSNLSQVLFQWSQLQQVLAQRQNIPCPHGPECILCQEKATREAYQLQKLDEERKAKKEDYENRCKEYLKKFRGNK